MNFSDEAFLLLNFTWAHSFSAQFFLDAEEDFSFPFDMYELYIDEGVRQIVGFSVPRGQVAFS